MVRAATIDSGDLFRLAIFGVFLVVIVYACVRTASFAYFRSRFEHFRRVYKAMKEGDN